MLLRCKGNMKSLINIYSLRILSFFKPRLILSSQLEKERVQLAFVLQEHLSWLTSLISRNNTSFFHLVYNSSSSCISNFKSSLYKRC